MCFVKNPSKPASHNIVESTYTHTRYFTITENTEERLGNSFFDGNFSLSHDLMTGPIFEATQTEW